MGYRRQKDRVRATREWATFVARNVGVIRAAGLPDAVTESISHWDDFLMHGYLDHHSDPSGFNVGQLSGEQYGALRQLVESYFVSGYEYFTPAVLRGEDRQRFEARFRNG